MIWLRPVIVLALALFAGACATGPKRLGPLLAPGPWALAPSQIEVWQPFGLASLPDPAASTRLSSQADTLLSRSVTPCAGAVVSPSQLALFEHLARLLQANPRLWQTSPGVGAVALPPGCQGVLIVRGMLPASTTGWLALGAIDGAGLLVSFRYLEQVKNHDALPRLLAAP